VFVVVILSKIQWKGTPFSRRATSVAKTVVCVYVERRRSRQTRTEAEGGQCWQYGVYQKPDVQAFVQPTTTACNLNLTLRPLPVKISFCTLTSKNNFAVSSLKSDNKHILVVIFSTETYNAMLRNCS